MPAWSGAGKNDAAKKTDCRTLCKRYFASGLIKHTHHNMDVDKQEKDSYELGEASA
ncbi:molybdopterin-guanine dinucleotide biosynthesis protein MobB [Shigella flexneri]